MIGGVTIGLATVALPAWANSTTTNMSSNNKSNEELQDSKTKYPVPPFNGQSQPWPGLASKMDPVPDHGEKGFA